MCQALARMIETADALIPLIEFRLQSLQQYPSHESFPLLSHRALVDDTMNTENILLGVISMT